MAPRNNHIYSYFVANKTETQVVTEDIGCGAGTQISLDPKQVISETEQSEGLDSPHGFCSACEVLNKYMSLNYVISEKFHLYSYSWQ